MNPLLPNCDTGYQETPSSSTHTDLPSNLNLINKKTLGGGKLIKVKCASAAAEEEEGKNLHHYCKQSLRMK